MEKKFVKVAFEVHCEWVGFPPEYRIYLNTELFAERLFKWNNKTYIKEIMQVEAGPGIYEFRLEELEPKSGNFTISNSSVLHGDAIILHNNRFEIQ